MIGTIEVSLEHLKANARALASLIAPARASFVLKSNAYGHGLEPVARALAPQSDRFCVYAIDEAFALRDAGITLPILVMGPVETRDLADAIGRGIDIALWDRNSYVQSLAKAARAAGAPANVHVKFDTGVARLGLEPAHARAAVERYAGTPELRIAGVFSHLASAEELDSPFTHTQLRRFVETLAEIESSLPERPIRHIAASAAAMLWPETRMDMARIGIALYGLWPSPQTRAAMNGGGFTLQPALSLRSQLVATRDVAGGTPIGYGNAYHAPKQTRIGVIPLGYADGIPRALSNKGAFLVNGARAPIAGRVCMNMTMIDLAGAPAAHTGTSVTLIGRDGNDEITADDWAAWAETINYEIVTRLPERIPRAYR